MRPVKVQDWNTYDLHTVLAQKNYLKWVYIYLFKFLDYTAAYSKSFPKSSFLPPFQCVRMLSSQSKSALSMANPKQVHKPLKQINKTEEKNPKLCWQCLALWKRNFRQRVKFRYWKEDLTVDEQKQSQERGGLIKKMVWQLRGVAETPKGKKKKKKIGRLGCWKAQIVSCFHLNWIFFHGHQIQPRSSWPPQNSRTLFPLRMKVVIKVMNPFCHQQITGVPVMDMEVCRGVFLHPHHYRPLHD